MKTGWNKYFFIKGVMYELSGFLYKSSPIENPWTLG